MYASYVCMYIDSENITKLFKMSEAGDHNKNDQNKPLFRDLTADELDPEATVIESLCMNCGKNVSRLLKYVSNDFNKYFTNVCKRSKF